MSKPVCVILGAGPGNGQSFAKKFSDEGYEVALCSRDKEKLNRISKDIKNSHIFQYDATDAEGGKKVLRMIKERLGNINVLIYNAGAGQFANIEDATLQGFENAWEINTKGLFVAAKEVIPIMRESGSGNIVIIGATASLRGGANFLPFASAKAAQRSLSQSLARHLGKENIHVSYVVIDGVIGLEKTKENMPDKPDNYFMNADDIAESVYFLTQQPKSAWTFEMDLRPFGENW